MQSRDASGISYNMAERCWPVHEALLSIVQPKLILVFGNSGFSPYGFIHKKYGGEQTYIPAGHGDWSIKKFSTKIGGSQVTVVGLPHLSRYDPIGKMYIIDWIK
jgi:uracil-DNA glycosylase